MIMLYVRRLSNSSTGSSTPDSSCCGGEGSVGEVGEVGDGGTSFVRDVLCVATEAAVLVVSVDLAFFLCRPACLPTLMVMPSGIAWCSMSDDEIDEPPSDTVPPSSSEPAPPPVETPERDSNLMPLSLSAGMKEAR